MGLEPINEMHLLMHQAREQVQAASEYCARLRESVKRADLDLEAAKASLLEAQEALKRAQALGSRFPHGWIDAPS